MNLRKSPSRLSVRLEVSKHLYGLLLRRYFLGALEGSAPFLLSEHTAAGGEVEGSSGLARGIQRATAASASVLGPAWMMSPPAAVESGVSHESSMNWPSLRGNKSGVSLTRFADPVQRHWLCLGCWNMGANTGNMKREGGAFDYFLTPRWGGKSGKTSQICGEGSRAHDSDHCKILAVILTHRWVRPPNLGTERRAST